MTEPTEMAFPLGQLTIKFGIDRAGANLVHYEFDEAALEIPAETIIGSLETVKFQTLMANREGTQ